MSEDLTPQALSQFREVQTIAHRCLLAVADELAPGLTEREAAAMIEGRLRSEGVRKFFHVPFAWFGDRTALAGISTPLDFFPTTRTLEVGTPVVLDVAPVVDGYVAGAAHSCSVGDNTAAKQAAADLRPFRSLIGQRVNRGDSRGEIYRAVEDLVVDLGYHNRHRRYPFGALGHRVTRQRRLPVDPRLLGFSAVGATQLLGRALAARLPARLTRHVPALAARSPFVNVGPGSDEPLEQGLWLFEPHISRDGVGAKFKEVLVVGEANARWLDDSPPHVQRWAKDLQ